MRRPRLPLVVRWKRFVKSVKGVLADNARDAQWLVTVAYRPFLRVARDLTAEVDAILHKKIVSGRERWRAFRELCVPKWSAAFVAAIERCTGQTEFTYVTAVTRLEGSRRPWEQNQQFRASIGGNPIKVLGLSEMLATVMPKLSATVANTSIGRFLQLVKAAGLKIHS